MYNQLAWRNIWRNPRRTLIILTAIFIGVCSMILLGALMRGMSDGMVNNAIENLTGHVRIQHKAYREDPSIDNRMEQPQAILKAIRSMLPEEARLAERIRVEGVISTARENRGVVLVGTNFKNEEGVSFIGDAPLEGRAFSKGDPNGIVIGKSLQEKLGMRLGSKVVVMSQGADGEIASRAFRILGVYRSNMKDTEDAVAFVSLEAARQMLGLDSGLTEVSIVLAAERPDDAAISTLTGSLRERLVAYPVVVEDWKEMLPAMHAYLQMFNGFLFIWYVVVFIAMGFGIVNTVLMAVYERMREFGLIQAIGMRPAGIFRMVLHETLMLLVIGMGAGNLAALLLVKILARTGINLSAFAEGTEMWGIDRVILPVLLAGDLLSANVTVFVLGLLVGIYPALKATRFNPVETMRNL